MVNESLIRFLEEPQIIVLHISEGASQTSFWVKMTWRLQIDFCGHQKITKYPCLPIPTTSGAAALLYIMAENLFALLGNDIPKKVADKAQTSVPFHSIFPLFCREEAGYLSIALRFKAAAYRAR